MTELGKRIWYRHALEGTRGYMIEVDGKPCIKLDRPNDPHSILPYVRSNWIPERESRPYTRAAVARVAFEADKALCMAQGDHVRARLDWLSLRDEERIEWMAGTKRPPRELSGRRRELFLDIMRRLEPYATE